jgi:hypothetical protein
MSLQLSTSARDGENNALTTAVGATGQLRIYTGSAPANCGTAASGTLLSQHALGNPFAPGSSSGVLSPTLPSNVNASNTGTAGYWRVYDNAGTNCHMQGTCGTSGTDMILNTTSLVSGGPVQISGWTITQGAA